MALISYLWRYPLKGARGENINRLEVHPDIGVIGDRQHALKRKSTVPSDQWSPKGMFFVGMNSPKIAAHKHPNVSFTDAYLEEIGRLLELPEAPAVLHTNGRFNITDTNGPSVSFLNLASVRELSRFMGTEVYPSRFRMNVWLEGLAPFEELEWVNGYPGDRAIMVGSIPFRVDDACERCKATEANPLSGEFDLPILESLEALMRERGYEGSPHRGKHAVMGILANPLGTGAIDVGDEVSLS